MIDFEEYISSLLAGYRTNYDIEMSEDSSDDLYAFAHMHVEHQQKFILKEFVMSSADADEYVYFFRVPHLTEDIAKAVIDRAYDDGFPRIKLDHVEFRHQHMCTRLVALVICDDADEAALKIIKKCRIYKSFQFSLKGWMEMHSVVMTLSDAKVYSNQYGRDTAKYLKKHVGHYLSLHAE